MSGQQQPPERTPAPIARGWRRLQFSLRAFLCTAVLVAAAVGWMSTSQRVDPPAPGGFRRARSQMVGPARQRGAQAA